ncbi:dihydrolipoamide dehydrogenase [Aerococcus urinaeequi]|uniref:dihydrolipoamide dehydrogenase n=1 Tax=Aerococcus urinaeequi TaxID=51665 RepID=UPI0022E41A65|nr:dihydrolipoamide dehydrogenase [Aerococcus urinaeequi]
MEKLIWTGLDENAFRPYKSWINKDSPGICGTYCAAVLTHFIVLRETNHRMAKQDLIDAYKKVVDDYHLHSGTFYWNVETGLNSVFNFENYRAKSGLLPDIEVPKLIDQYQAPVIVGTLKYLGSAYKNHWLLVYAYAYDEQNNLYFKAYDNHGKHNAVIPAKQTNAYVYLEPIQATTIEPSTDEIINEVDDFTKDIAIETNQARQIFLKRQAKEAEERKKKQIFGKEWDEWKDMII